MGKQLYKKPVRGLMRDMVEDLNLKKGDVFTSEQVAKWFYDRYPKIKKNTISAHLIMMSTNAPSRIHYNAKPGDDDLFFKVNKSDYRLYERETDPQPIYEKKIDDVGIVPRFKSRDKLTNEIVQLVNNYFMDMEKSRVELKQRVVELELENKRLNEELKKDKSIMEEISDIELRNRVALLESVPLDVLIREAGVILEVRIRRTAGIESNEVGAKLVDEIFNPQTGLLIYSENYGEQQGIQMLFRGAMQFIRNPPMHKQIEYPEGTARNLMKMIDSLLQLLSELNPKTRGEVEVDDIRRMLIRAPIQPNQRMLFKVLYGAGKEGMDYDGLATAIGLSRKQLSGVVGGLGRRINQTKGLENKGGASLVFDIKMTSEGKLWYCMRTILRKALEEEDFQHGT